MEENKKIMWSSRIRNFFKEEEKKKNKFELWGGNDFSICFHLFLILLHAASAAAQGTERKKVDWSAWTNRHNKVITLPSLRVTHAPSKCFAINNWSYRKVDSSSSNTHIRIQMSCSKEPKRDKSMSPPNSFPSSIIPIHWTVVCILFFFRFFSIFISHRKILSPQWTTSMLDRHHHHHHQYHCHHRLHVSPIHKFISIKLATTVTRGDRTTTTTTMTPTTTGTVR